MKYILILIAVLFNAPAFAVDLEEVEAVIKSCQSGTSCSCPRAKISLPTMKQICGEDPPIKLDSSGNWINKKEQDSYGECQKKAFKINDEISRYNSIFDHCQHPYAKNENVNRPLLNRPDYSKAAGPSSGKTLAEQVAEAKEQDPDDIDRKVAERERAQEAARAAQVAPQASAPSPQAEQNQCFRNSRSGMNVQAGYGSPDFFLVCLDPNKTEHWGNATPGQAPNGDGLVTAGPNEFKMLMRTCLRASAQDSCPECCRPTP